VSVSLSVDGPGDAELISAVRGGDVDAYGELFARHVDAARRLARQLAGPADADDLVSDAFTKVLTVLQRGGGPDLAFRAYLLTAVRRLHVDRIRSGSRLKPVDDLTPFDPGLPFHDTAVEGFENAAAARAFATLPERWQMVLWHTEVEGQKPADIAPLLGMSANSVSALAYRAREGLRQAFLSQHATDPDDVDCAWTRDHLGAYVRGGLSRRDAGKVDDHLAECRACAAVYLELTEVNSGLAALLAPLLLGSAGAGYLSTSGGGAAAGGAASSGFAAARAWVGTHTSLTAVGGLAVTATALFAVYGATQLQGHGAADVGSPPGADRVAPASSGPAGGHGQHHGRAQGRQGSVPPAARTPGVALGTNPSSATGTSGTSPTGASTAPGAASSTEPGGGPSTEPTTGPPTTTPTSAPPSTGPTTGPTSPPPAAVTFTSTPPVDPALGTTYHVSATGGSGRVTFSIDPATTNDACSISGHTVTFDHAGRCVIAARDSSARIVAAKATTPVTQTVHVPKMAQTVTFTLTPDKAVVGGQGTLTATGEGGSGNQVTFSATTPSSCTVAGTTVTFDHAADCTVQADQAGTSDYRAGSSQQTVTVDKADQTIVFTSTPPTGATVGGPDYTVSATAPGGTVSFSALSPACSVSGSTVSFKAAGSCEIAADQSGDSDFNPAPTLVQTFDVAPAEDGYDLTVSATAVLDGKGNPQRIVVTVSGLPADGTAVLEATGPQDLHTLKGENCPCSVTGPTQTFEFAYNTNQSPTATLVFTATTTDSPDPDTTNDSATMTFPVESAQHSFARRTQS
jgi:RNA polymerase sigma factor (sigma-70 family)